jgi:hypothetical protein
LWLVVDQAAVLLLIFLVLAEQVVCYQTQQMPRLELRILLLLGLELHHLALVVQTLLPYLLLQ